METLSQLAPLTCWGSLPAELKCKILSFVPTSTSKLALRFVSVEWAPLLDLPESHGRDCEAMALWGKPTVPTALLQPLRALHVEQASCGHVPDLARLPPLLEVLYLGLESAKHLRTLPSLARLESLSLEISIYGRAALPQLDPVLLPSLKRLSVEFCDVANRTCEAEALCSRLHAFPSLVFFHYTILYMEGFLNIPLPADCRMSVEVRGGQPDYAAHPAVQASLVSLQLLDYCHKDPEDPLPCVDLHFLKGCSRLEELFLEVPGRESWELQGLSRLPAGLREVVVRCGRVPSYNRAAVAQTLHAKNEVQLMLRH